MKLLVIGATGGLGRHVVDQAVQRGHDVTVFVRDAARTGASAGRVQVVVGDATADDDALAAAVRGQDVVISALGVGSSFKPDGLIAKSAPRIVRAMEREGVRRLIFTSAFGVGGSYGGAPLIARIFFRTLLRRIYADKAAGEPAVRDSTLDWTLVYPTKFTNGPRTGRYRAGEHLELRGLISVSRADVADFLLTEAEAPKYVRKVVLISD
jgi:putative NADH-flavin reductase